MKTKYLIIGNSAGGIGAAEAIREVDKTGSITIISDEPYPVYSRPLISEYLAEGRPLEKMLYRPADFYDKNDIRTLLGTRANRLDTDNHSVELENGKSITWKKLLLATGGSPIVPEIKGIKKKSVFTFITLDEAKAIDRHLNGTSRAVVIGGGLIGLSATEALVKRGVEVTIVEMKDWILNVMLDKEASAFEETALRKAGVEIITGHTVAEINGDPSGDENVRGVTLDNGKQIPCEMVVVAIGVTPRTELSSGTGIKAGRGIVVDRKMATSRPDIYACGDVVEAFDFTYSANRLTPIWPNAYIGGRVAGFNMAGISAEYPGGTAMNSLKYFGVNIVSAGIVNPPDDGYETLSKIYDHSYRKVILKDGLVVGMVLVGNIDRAGIIFSLIKDRVNADSFKQALLEYDFGLASLPEEIWRPRLEATAGLVSSAMPAENRKKSAAKG